LTHASAACGGIETFTVFVDGDFAVMIALAAIRDLVNFRMLATLDHAYKRQGRRKHRRQPKQRQMTSAAHEVRFADWHSERGVLSKIRFDVFVLEQGVPPELELDELDADSAQVIHVVATNATGDAIGTARMLLEKPLPRIGRMAVLRDWRGKGIGQEMLELLCEDAKRRGYHAIRLNSQTHATPFYYKQGFLSVGAEFVEAGIPHLEMRRSL